MYSAECTELIYYVCIECTPIVNYYGVAGTAITDRSDRLHVVSVTRLRVMQVVVRVATTRCLRVLSYRAGR